MNSASNQDDNLKPEELARVHIDANLRSVGWNIVNRDQFVIDKTQIVRENLMKGGKEADYVIFIKGKAIGVIEAKRGEIDVSDKSVISQVVDRNRIILADMKPCF